MSKTVFIVEDDPIQQKMLEHHFENMVGSFVVKTFSRPEEIMMHIHERPFAIVLDHYFGHANEKTGLDYLKLIKRKSSIPVIYYTASEDTELKEQALKMGAAQYICKDEASFVRLRTALDQLANRKGKGFFKRLFSSE